MTRKPKVKRVDVDRVVLAIGKLCEVIPVELWPKSDRWTTKEVIVYAEVNRYAEGLPPRRGKK
jgi:hypothetical protein